AIGLHEDLLGGRLRASLRRGWRNAVFGVASAILFHERLTNPNEGKGKQPFCSRLLPERPRQHIANLLFGQPSHGFTIHVRRKRDWLAKSYFHVDMPTLEDLHQVRDEICIADPCNLASRTA